MENDNRVRGAILWVGLIGPLIVFSGLDGAVAMETRVCLSLLECKDYKLTCPQKSFIQINRVTSHFIKPDAQFCRPDQCPGSSFPSCCSRNGTICDHRPFNANPDVYALFDKCSGKGECSQVKVDQSKGCTEEMGEEGRIRSHVDIRYSCVREEETINLCSNVTRTFSDEIHAIFNSSAFSPTQQSFVQTCTCTIHSYEDDDQETVSMTIQDVRLRKPSTDSCSSAVLNTETSLETGTRSCGGKDPEESFFSVMPVDQSLNVSVQLKNLYMNGSDDIPKMVWLIFKPDEEEKPLRISCSTQAVRTWTPEGTADRRPLIHVAAIIIPVVFIAIMLALIFVVGCLWMRRRNRKRGVKPPPGGAGSGSTRTGRRRDVEEGTYSYIDPNDIRDISRENNYTRISSTRRTEGDGADQPTEDDYNHLSFAALQVDQNQTFSRLGDSANESAKETQPQNAEIASTSSAEIPEGFSMLPNGSIVPRPSFASISSVNTMDSFDVKLSAPPPDTVSTMTLKSVDAVIEENDGDVDSDGQKMDNCDKGDNADTDVVISYPAATAREPADGDNQADQSEELDNDNFVKAAQTDSATKNVYFLPQNTNKSEQPNGEKNKTEDADQSDRESQSDETGSDVTSGLRKPTDDTDNDYIVQANSTGPDSTGYEEWTPKMGMDVKDVEDADDSARSDGDIGFPDNIGVVNDVSVKLPEKRNSFSDSSDDDQSSSAERSRSSSESDGHDKMIKDVEITEKANGGDGENSPYGTDKTSLQQDFFGSNNSPSAIDSELYHSPSPVIPVNRQITQSPATVLNSDDEPTTEL